MDQHQLRAFRQWRGLSQAELARLLDVAPNTVARWEQGRLPIPRLLPLALETIARRLALDGANQTGDQEVSQMRVIACVDEKSAAPKAVNELNGDYYLERVQNISATEIEFRVLLGPKSSAPGSIIDPNGLHRLEWLRKKDQYHFFLEGSFDRWSIQRSFCNDQSGGELIVALRRE